MTTQNTTIIHHGRFIAFSSLLKLELFTNHYYVSYVPSMPLSRFISSPIDAIEPTYLECWIAFPKTESVSGERLGLCGQENFV
jgi:hypothetical protein